MAIEDLDLEFEDDEEVSGTEALDVDVDLSFSANEEEEAAAKGRPAPRKRPRPRGPGPADSEDSPAEENIADIGQARARTRANTQAGKPNLNNRANGNTGNGDINDLREEIAILKQQMQAIEHQADVRVAVAEAEKEYLIEYVSNAKILDHQVTQVLSRINKKVPQLATEVKMIKKYVNEFLGKSSPKKKKKDAA